VRAETVPHDDPSNAAESVEGCAGAGRRRLTRMATKRYVALLRGINVGGNNPVAMVDLRQAFEDAGYGAVRTYINSGNVLFESAASPTVEVEVERMVAERFGIPRVVVRSHDQVRRIVRGAPEGFGASPDVYHSDVIFLKAPLTAKQAMRIVSRREGVDQAWPGTGVLYFARLSAERTKSRMGTIVGTPEYRQMTIRNWSTTTKLLALLDRSSEA
jgi:uncharacterized protein (DUF1697 family)